MPEEWFRRQAIRCFRLKSFIELIRQKKCILTLIEISQKEKKNEQTDGNEKRSVKDRNAFGGMQIIIQEGKERRIK